MKEQCQLQVTHQKAWIQPWCAVRAEGTEARQLWRKSASNTCLQFLHALWLILQDARIQSQKPKCPRALRTCLCSTGSLPTSFFRKAFEAHPTQNKLLNSLPKTCSVDLPLTSTSVDGRVSYQTKQLEGEDLLGVYEFPMAAVTSYHNLSVLKQHTFILLQFWRSKEAPFPCLFHLQRPAALLGKGLHITPTLLPSSHLFLLL